LKLATSGKHILKLLFELVHKTSFLLGDKKDHYFAGILNKNIQLNPKPVYKNKSDYD
jgi:hypothetical protein